MTAEPEVVETAWDKLVSSTVREGGGSILARYPNVRWSPHPVVDEVRGGWTPVFCDRETAHAAQVYQWDIQAEIDRHCNTEMFRKAAALSRELGVPEFAVRATAYALGCHRMRFLRPSSHLTLVGDRESVNAVIYAARLTMHLTDFEVPTYALHNRSNPDMLWVPGTDNTVFTRPAEPDRRTHVAFQVSSRSASRWVNVLPPDNITLAAAGSKPMHTPDVLLSTESEIAVCEQTPMADTLARAVASLEYAPSVMRMAALNGMDPEVLATLCVALHLYMTSNDTPPYVEIRGKDSRAAQVWVMTAVSLVSAGNEARELIASIEREKENTSHEQPQC